MSIRMVRGDTKILLIDAYDSNGSAYSPSVDDVIILTVRRLSDGVKVIWKTSDDDDVTVVTGGWQIVIQPADTENLTYEYYQYDVEVTLADGYKQTVVECSLFELVTEIGYLDPLEPWSPNYSILTVTVNEVAVGESSGTVTKDSTGLHFALNVAKGNGIASVVRTAGNGLPGTVDTYTITFDDGTMQTYDVAHGVQGVQGIQGLTGNGIDNIARTSGDGSPGMTDTYTIAYTDETADTFTVYNGANGDITGVTVDGAEVVPAAGVVDLTDTFSRYALWRKTSSANPVPVYPVPESPLYPKVSGTYTQSGIGDPSPSNIRPITPWLASGGTAKVKRTGKNLLPKFTNQTVNGITLTVDADGTCHLSGTATAQATFVFTLDNPLNIYPITLSANNPVKTTGASFLRVGLTASYCNTGLTGYTNATFTYTDPSQILGSLNSVDIRVASGQTLSDFIMKPQLEYGVVAAPYEPYTAEDISLTAPQEIAAGWMDNEGHGQMTWTRFVLNSSSGIIHELVGGTVHNFYLPPPLFINGPNYTKSSHFPFGGSTTPSSYYVSGTGRINVRPDIAGINSLSTFNAWLDAQVTAGTPFTVVGQLATPVSITPTIAPLIALPQLDRITPRQNVLTATPASGIELTYAKSPIQESIDVAAAIAAD